MFTQRQIEQHVEAAEKLEQITQAAFEFISENRATATEHQAKEFIQQSLKFHGMRSEPSNPMVSFGRNTSNVHYFAAKNSSARLEDNDLIMIDLWARKNEKGAPFADITWMGLCGDKLGGQQLELYQHVIKARDLAVELISLRLSQKIMPNGAEIDQAVRNYFQEYNLSQHFLHALGHPLGFTSAHGRAGGCLWGHNTSALKPDVAYTIEPGLYLKGEFGIRSEINFYISEKLELVITTKPQREIVALG